MQFFDEFWNLVGLRDRKTDVLVKRWVAIDQRTCHENTRAKFRVLVHVSCNPLLRLDRIASRSNRRNSGAKEHRKKLFARDVRAIRQVDKVHMGVDQAWNQELPLAINDLRALRDGHRRAYGLNTFALNDHRSVKEASVL